MQTYNVCIWMFAPSHYQSSFFEALNASEQVRLKVVYFDQIMEYRKGFGWNDTELKDYEVNIQGNDKVLDKILEDEKDSIHIIPGNRNPFLKILLEKIIRKDIKWVHWSEASGINLSKKVFFNKKLFIMLHPLFLKFSGYSKYAQIINKYALGAFTQGIKGEKDLIKWGIRPEKIEHLFYVVNEQKCDSKQKNMQDRYAFVSVGSLEKRKGTEYLIRAFSMLKNAEKWKLVFVGPDKSSGKYKKLAKKIGVLSSIDFVGTVKFSEVKKYLCESDVYVFSTLFDGWGVVLNEAASLSLPLISTDASGASYHLLKNGENGYLVKSKSIQELADAMQKYIDNPNIIEEYGKKSFEIFQDYTPKKNVDRLIKALQKWTKNNEL